MSTVREHALIERLAGGFRGSPRQLNARHESDAELLRLPGTDAVLALTTDAVVEEIAAGLYDEPWLAGWMAVTVNASDLAAVGADPLGLVMGVTLPPAPPDALLSGLRAGIADAAATHALPLLGGDTNRGPALALAGTAVGLIPDGRPLTRCGARPGDFLFASGPLGRGAAFALARLAGRRDVPYRPRARLREGRLVRAHGSCCMDTSDGLIPTLDELTRRNRCGFRLTRPAEALLDGLARGAARAAGLPPWALLAGPHGEFELVFTVPAARRDDFHAAAAAVGWRPLALGRVTDEAGVVRPAEDETGAIDTGGIRNLFDEVGGDPARYVRALLPLVPGAPAVSSAPAPAAP